MESNQELKIACSVCLEENKPMIFPLCNHEICCVCFKKWSKQGKYCCPTCRRDYYKNTDIFPKGKNLGNKIPKKSKKEEKFYEDIGPVETKMLKKKLGYKPICAVCSAQYDPKLGGNFSEKSGFVCIKAHCIKTTIIKEIKPLWIDLNFITNLISKISIFTGFSNKNLLSEPFLEEYFNLCKLKTNYETYHTVQLINLSNPISQPPKPSQMRHFFSGLKERRLGIISSILRESISSSMTVEEIRKLVRDFEPNDFCASSYAKSIAKLAELQNMSDRVKNAIARNIEEKLLYCPVLPNYSNVLPRMPVVKVMHKFVITSTYMAMISLNNKGTLDVLYWEEKTRIAQIQETEGMPSNITKTPSAPLPSMVSKILGKKPYLSNDQKALNKVLSEYQDMQVDFLGTPSCIYML